MNNTTNIQLHNTIFFTIYHNNNITYNNTYICESIITKYNTAYITINKNIITNAFFNNYE